MFSPLSLLFYGILYRCKEKCNSTQNVPYLSQLGIRHAHGPMVQVPTCCMETMTHKNQSNMSSCLQCYHLSKWPNCFPDTCGGLTSWPPRCTTDASSRTRPIIIYPSPYLMIALVTQSGGVSPTTPALSITYASAPVQVPFPQLSPPVHHYHPTPPSPCTLGQQVTTYRLVLLSCTTMCSYCFDHSQLVHYCLRLLIVSQPLLFWHPYCDYIRLLLVV